MLKLELKIAAATPSANAWAGRSRWSYREYQRRWLRLISDSYFEARTEFGANCWPKPPRQKVRVTVERFTPRENALDFDNFVGGAKVCLDSLVKTQLVDNDTPAAIEVVYRQPRNPVAFPRYWTRVTLERDVEAA